MARHVGVAAFVSWSGNPDQQFVRWRRDTDEWVPIESSGAPWNTTCVDVGSGWMVASGLAGDEAKVPQVRQLDPVDGRWSEPIEVPQTTLSSPVSCSLGHVMFSTYGATSSGAMTTTTLAPGSPVSLPTSVLYDVDLATREVDVEDLGETHLGVRFVGPWVFKEQIDESWRRELDESRVNGTPGPDLGNPPTTTWIRRIDQAEWQPYDGDIEAGSGFGYSVDPGWTGGIWLGLNTGPNGPDEQFTAWVPPPVGP